jgi:predicted transcriptional regulator
MKGAYDMAQSTETAVCSELRQLRMDMGYSLGEMAELLKVPKATYQCYENGRRTMPPGFINRVREWQQIDLDFFAGLNERVDARVEAEFDGVIPSEL